MVKKPNGVAKATATSADAAAQPSKENPSTPGLVKASKFKKRKVKANRAKQAVAAAAIDEVAPVGAGTGDGDASASVALPQPSDVAEALPVVQTPKSTTFAEASPVAQTQKPATDVEGLVPAPIPTTAVASASSPKPKPAQANADAAAAISASKGNGVGADNSRGDGEMKNKKERAMSGKGKEVMEEGGSKGKGKGKGKKAVVKKEERGDRKVAGFIFMCNAKTKKECYQSRLFGMPSGKIEMVKKIRPGVKLFLYDFDLKLLYGVYKAASHGGLNLVHEAFNGKFPAQVKFKIDKDCRPLPESSLKQAIKENYNAKSKFDPELTTKQVQRLLLLFKPVSAPQSVSNNHLGERRHYEKRRKPRHFEERRPIEAARRPRFDEERRPAVRHVPFEDPYRAPRYAPVPVDSQHGHSLASDHHRYYQPALTPEPRQLPLVLEPRYVPPALDHHHVPELRHAPPAYYRTLAPSGDSYYRSVENLVPERYADRTMADLTTRDPIIRDHTALPGEALARADRLDDLYRSDRVEELYRSDRLVNRAVDRPHPAYFTAAYETNPAYAETSIRPVSARVNGPSAAVSSLYSFSGGPVYR
ncbi:B2 protein [Zea mays]|uniref:DCD domain-containing protein n=2 Tax=Zea mays TaxID=4577 RepID=A0A3L6EBU5_MAIZE|nr:hypothetical protein Zm00014a_040928 [Zea mays]PWZ18495.1 hypothetical protein Zm00014a_040928 [Zea mays]PWZ18496.1 B2 protein [Zea mays]